MRNIFSGMVLFCVERRLRRAAASILLLGALGVAVLLVFGAREITASEEPAEPVKEHFVVYPIGVVRLAEGRAWIELEEKYKPGLLRVDKLSYINVYYWFDRNDTPMKRSILQVHPRGKKENPLTGVFATRSPVRPNLIAQTRCKVLGVHDNIIEIDTIDAFDKSPVIDLKNGDQLEGKEWPKEDEE